MNRVIVAALATLAFTLGSMAAEPTETEQHIRELAQKSPTSSVVFMDVQLFQEGKEQNFCSTITVRVVSDEGLAGGFRVLVEPSFFGHKFDSAQHGGIAFLPPGTYTIVTIECAQDRLRGKFARFGVGTNEIINAGRLVMDFKKSPAALFSQRTFDARTRVEDLGPKALESITKRTPNIFPKAKKRYMTSNPATMNPRPRR